jgi:hypothetical protein
MELSNDAFVDHPQHRSLDGRVRSGELVEEDHRGRRVQTANRPLRWSEGHPIANPHGKSGKVAGLSERTDDDFTGSIQCSSD